MRALLVSGVAIAILIAAVLGFVVGLIIGLRGNLFRVMDVIRKHTTWRYPPD